MTTLNYDEVQEEEVEVLKAIYMDDFEAVEVKSAWNKTTERHFKLRLRAFSDETSFVTIHVKLTATYPKSAPGIEVDGLDSFHERTQTRVRNMIRERTRQLLGEVMIHAIASEIQDALEDAVQARRSGALPSLEDERANAQEAALALDKESRAVDALRQKEELEEEDRVLKQMVEEEVSRRERKKPGKTAAVPSLGPASSVLGSERIAFDQTAEIKGEHDMWSFSSVTLMATIAQTKDEQLYLGKPDVMDQATSPLITIKRITIRKSREEIMDLETQIEQVRKLRHTTLLSLYAFRVDKIDGHKSQLVTCTEHADRGSLHDMLDLGMLRHAKARLFATELLEGLDYLHRHGVAHNNLNCKTILLSGSGSPSLRLADFGYSWLISAPHNSLPMKWQIPQCSMSNPNAQRKGDVWAAGVIVAQMFLGKESIIDYASPQAMIHRLQLSYAFEDFVKKMFTLDFRKRPSAFELLPCEFLRTDSPVLADRDLALPARLHTSHIPAGANFGAHRSRHNSSNVMESTSRYATDFTELGRLGKGGFGEVVKARNKLDGGVYAVKKIKQSQQLLDKVLSEVMLLNRLNHPYVVRYYSTWVEQDFSKFFPIEAVSTTDESSDDDCTDTETTADEQLDFGYQSTGGLDFVSSSGYPHIEFGDDNDDDDDDDEYDDDDDDNDDINDDNDSHHRMRPARKAGGCDSNDASALDGTASSAASGARPLRPGMERTRSDSRRIASVLYIQMEYCERQTLRDLIRRGIAADDAWRYARQITEGLAHIHSHGIIHRDLKPDNIFIDVAGNPKIGDFGLATTSQYQVAGKQLILSGTSGIDLTRSVGTALYVAPELRSSSSVPYNDKVDMYSLGVIFYEMCETFGTAMERIRALQSLREHGYELPIPYQPNGDLAAQGRLISCLVCHKPSDRPSSMELLRSDVLPLKIEDETIRQALSGLSDPRSPYHQKMMSALFSYEGASSARVKALAWDAKSHGSTEDAQKLRVRNAAKTVLETIFRRHGAEETRRESIFPRSALYTSANVVQLLDASSNLLQLPYDLVLPHARQLAGQMPVVRKSFTFGSAYRDAFTGGPPRVSEEVDFDIASVQSTRRLELDEAEVIKVTDEIINELPFFVSTSTISFHLGHSDILDAVLEFSRVSGAQQALVKETISRLGFYQWNWAKVRAELRKFGLPDTTLEDLEQFDFRDVPEKAFDRIRKIFNTADPRLSSKLEEAISSLTELVAAATNMDLKRRIYVAPLASVNARFYERGMLFQCVLERKSNRTVLAAGGRYDKLIQSYRPVDGRSGAFGAVGVAIGMDPIVTHMLNNARNSAKEGFLKSRSSHKAETLPKRCDVAILTSGSPGTRTAGVRILTTFWANGISCELIDGAHPLSDDGEYGWIITIRHEASLTVRCRSTTGDADEGDIPVAALVSHIQQEMRERDHNKVRPTAVHRHSSHQDQERSNNVHVLMAQYRSKKSNKYHIVEAAQNRWTEEIEGWKKAPILAIETRDDVLGLIRETRLGDLETWRHAVQNASLNERQYLQQVQTILSDWRKKWQENLGGREACVFNFRTGSCIYYDLGN